MKFLAVIFDIDGTLLDSQGHISDSTVHVIHRCAQNNIPLYIATARPERLVFRPTEVPSETAGYLTQRAVFYNGAIAIDKPFSYYRHWSIPAGTVYSITNDLMEALADINIAIQCEDQYHSFRLPIDDATITSWGFSRDELLPFSEARHLSCSKIVTWHETEDLSGLYNRLYTDYGGKINLFITDSCHWIQIMNHDASKENALLTLLSLRNIPPEEVIVFGDDIPDMGMFKTFGYSVAMGNAPTALKQAATYVTCSNNNDGIAYAFETYFDI